MKPPRSSVYYLVAAFLALAPIALHAQTPNPILLFTEQSDTSLTATLNGNPFGTVTNTGTDQWDWRSGVFGDLTTFQNANTPYWAEPGPETGVNDLISAGFDFNSATGLSNLGFVINSDLPSNGISLVNPNGGYGFTMEGSANGQLVLGPVDVYFSDLGDGGAKTPDGASTLALLGLSLAALAGVSRLRRTRERI